MNEFNNFNPLNSLDPKDYKKVNRCISPDEKRQLTNKIAMGSENTVPVASNETQSKDFGLPSTHSEVNYEKELTIEKVRKLDFEMITTIDLAGIQGADAAEKVSEFLIQNSGKAFNFIFL